MVAAPSRHGMGWDHPPDIRREGSRTHRIQALRKRSPLLLPLPPHDKPEIHDLIQPSALSFDFTLPGGTLVVAEGILSQRFANALLFWTEQIF